MKAEEAIIDSIISNLKRVVQSQNENGQQAVAKKNVAMGSCADEKMRASSKE